MQYKPTIGLEVHAELNTKSKMFCGCKNAPHSSEVNSNICPVCLAQPGSLPVPNEKAIESVLLFGRAVGATAADYSEFDRKNYFYPDIPKAYQISQYAYPFLTGGNLEGVELTRVHLEEDTARNSHDKGTGSHVDFNRAGVPLMELVTEPVIHDAETAVKFAKELQLILKTIGISEANMEKGEMRVEANISVSKTEGVMAKKYVEVKNLNSFKSVEAAISFEIKRQIEVKESGGDIEQETRGWDEVKLRTFPQRSKETAKDYRYFPDPDIPKVKTSVHEQFSVSSLDEIIPILPSIRRELYSNLGLPSDQIEVIISDIPVAKFFQSIVDLCDDNKILKLAANYLTSDIMAILSSETVFSLESLSVEQYISLMKMLAENKIGSKAAKIILPDLFTTDYDPTEIAEKKNLLQVSDSAAVLDIVKKVIQNNPDQAKEMRAGKETVLKYLVGQGMKESKGSANPSILAEIFITELK